MAEDLSDQLDALFIEARSPDGQVRGWSRGVDSMGIEFVYGAYRSYDERALAHQLEQLATMVWVRYKRARDEVMDAYWDWPDRDDKPDWNSDYQARLESLVVTAQSASGAVTVTSRALLRWEFTLADGALRQFREGPFCVEVAEATMAAVARHRMMATLLRDEVYGPQVPRPAVP